MLQRIGAASVAAYNAFAMCNSLPEVSFLAMDARHCAGGEMSELMAYGASVGSRMAKEKSGAIGFTRLRHRSYGAVLWPRKRHGHDAACPDRLCRIDR